MSIAPPSSASSRTPSRSSRPSRPSNALFWGLLAAAALLWPSHLSGPVDGAPLDGAVEAILVGVAFPALWWFFPRFLHTRFARAAIVALLLSKALAAASTVQDGWCARFVPAGPIVKNETGVPHSWDLRADWRSPNPVCSAIVAHAYEGLGDFPAWFFNLPPPSDGRPGPADRPPGATTGLIVSGFIDAPAGGTLRLGLGPDIASVVAIDGSRVPAGPEGTVTLARGVHAINIDATLTGYRWRLAPSWNGTDLWSTEMATVLRPSRVDRIVRPWGRWAVTLLAVLLIAMWTAYAFVDIDDADVIAWMAGACGWFGVLGAMGHLDVVRGSVPLLAGAALLPVARRLRNVKGAFLLVGLPWLTLIVCLTTVEIGRFRLYEVGSDYWTFQRAAYRIVMQGYWLEGGSLTFWFQPLYRWFAGLLHVAFGDSSVGEIYWDAGWLLVGALFSFRIAKAFAGFRWGVTAAALTLAVVALDKPWLYIGRGLSEITSSGLIYLAALLAMQSRRRHWVPALAAGVLASLGFYTRLNSLPMATAVALFAWPSRIPAGSLVRPAGWIRRGSWTAAAIVLASVGVAVLLFAWRTWHYTGVFSVTYGTQAGFLAVWRPGMSVGAALSAMAGSVMMVLTMNDPAQFDPCSLPLLGGMAIALLALAGVPRLRALPLTVVLFCVAGISGALVARGSAYTGRFSIHLIPVTCAIVVCAVSAIVRPHPVDALVGASARPTRDSDPSGRTHESAPHQ